MLKIRLQYCVVFLVACVQGSHSHRSIGPLSPEPSPIPLELSCRESTLPLQKQIQEQLLPVSRTIPASTTFRACRRAHTQSA